MKKTTKDIILECATTLFAQEGYEGLRMDNLALSAKVNKATIYYYFQNKQTLYETIIKNTALAFYQILQDNLKNKKSDKERLEAFIDSALFFVQTHREIARIMMVELSYSWKNITVEAKKNFIPIIEMLKNILKNGEENKVFNQINPLLLQAILMGGFNYYLLMKDIFIDLEFSDKTDVDLNNGQKELKEMLLKSLVKG